MSVLDYIQLPFEQRDTILKVSGFDTNVKLSINHIIYSFFDRNDNKIIKLNQCLFNIILKLGYTKQTVEDLYKQLEEKSNNKIINIDDLKEILNHFLIREQDINGLINNWDYKNKEGFINIEDLTNHLKQRENIINDIVDINNEIKFGEINISNNINDESDKKSKSESEYSVNKVIDKESTEKKYNDYNNNNNSYLDKNNLNYTHQDLNTNLKESEIKNKKDMSKTIISKNNNDIYNYNYIDEYNDYNDYHKDKEKENENEVNDYNDFDNYAINNEFNNNIKEIEKSDKEEINNNDRNIDNENDNNNDNYDQNKSGLDIEQINNENEIKEKEEESSTKKKKKKSTSKKKKKGKKSKEKLNINEIINGELKVQVNNIENVMIPKTIYTPCSFYLYCSMEGIDTVLKSREVITDDLRNVVFNWATRVLLKKKTLKDLSCKCKINLSVEQKNKNISLGNCEFEWRKCLLKINWDKFAINETFQVLTERKFKKIPMGNIKILAKFIPFGSKN